MDLATFPPHLGESEILRLIDGDDEAGGLAEFQAHVGECAACADRVAAIRSDADRVRVALAEVRLPSGFPSAEQLMWRAQRASHGGARGAPGRGMQGWRRAAAIVLILLLPVALVRPIRAAVVEWVQRGWSMITGSENTAPAPPPADEAPAVPGGNFRIYFTPAEGVVELGISVRQQGGALRIETVAGLEGSLEIVGGAGEAALVTGRGLSIRNDAASRATYVMRVPEGVRTLRLRIGEEPAVALDRSALAGGRLIEITE
jgi:hypothetical protein